MTIGRIIARVGSGLSRFWNVVRHRGHWHTTTSARCYRDSILIGGAWVGRRKRIDWVFRYLDRNPDRQPHCQWAWHEKVKRANRTLNEDISIRQFLAGRDHV